MKHPLKRKLVNCLNILLGFTILGIPVVLWIGSSKILHPKRRGLEDRHLAVNENPADYGIILKSFEASSGDGISLKGYLVYPERKLGTATRTRRMLERLQKAGIEQSETPRGTVILMHGRGGRKEDMLTIAQRFVAADLRCIVYDARAHGMSGGAICTYGKLEKSDVTCVLNHVDGMIREKGENPGPIVAFGNSLGAAVMLQAIPGEPRIIAGVAAAPYADMKEEIIHTIGNVTSHLIPASLRGVFVETACWRGGFRTEEVVPEQSAKAISVPVFVAHGRRDKVIPIEQAKRVFLNLPENSRKWQEIPDAYHYNILAEGGDDLYEAMIHFYLEAISRNSITPSRS